MRPIAIAFKNYRINPFTNRGGGELMIIHKCLGCGKLSPNRIAGDDNEYEILKVLKESIDIDKNILVQITSFGLVPITNFNKEEAFISIFGINYQLQI
jgi:hypothetical protein